MSGIESREDLISTLEEELEESKVLDTFEDRYVYYFERIFTERDFINDGPEESELPELVVKAKSEKDVETVRNIADSNGYEVARRDRAFMYWKGLGEGTILIDYTDPLTPPPVPEREEPEEESWMRDLPTRYSSTPIIPMDEVIRGEVMATERCEDHSICQGYCPVGQTSYGGVETMTSKGRLIISRGICEEEIDHSERVSNILFSCAACGNCFRACTENLDRMNESWTEAKQRVIEDRDGVVPDTIRDALESTFRLGNPWQYPRGKRIEWTEELDLKVPIVEEGDSVDYLLFVGCTPSYDERNQDCARDMARVLMDKLGLDVGILGNEERCCGDHQRRMGEEGLFEMLVEENAEVLDKIDYDQMITISPHCYSTFTNEYVDYDVRPNSIHYTQLFDQMIKDGEIEFSNAFDEEKVVTYHDSCNLERHSDVYEEPRNILKAIPDANFVDIHTESLCCGGGGGRTWFDDPDVEKRVATAVIDRALNRGADVLATACPFCIIQFEDALKVMDAEEDLEIKDISELVQSAL